MTTKLGVKVAVVTGASKGTGTEMARRLAADGAAIVVNYSSSKQAADRVVADIERQGGKRSSREIMSRSKKPKSTIGCTSRRGSWWVGTQSGSCAIG
jgi:NAD(P)-dependent dehydrogenase (short-subunit alcohol dehydrogenase family)